MRERSFCREIRLNICNIYNTYSEGKELFLLCYLRLLNRYRYRYIVFKGWRILLYMTDDANDGNLSQIKRNEELSAMHTAPTILTVSVPDVSVLLLTITCG